jgi:hypothetical protein
VLSGLNDRVLRKSNNYIYTMNKFVVARGFQTGEKCRQIIRESIDLIFYLPKVSWGERSLTYNQSLP